MTDSGAITQAVLEQLRLERAAQGLTFIELAKKSSLADLTLRRYLRGDTAMPFEAFVKISDALGLSAGEVLQRAMQRIK